MKKIHSISSSKKAYILIFLTSIFFIIGLISRLFFVFGQPLWLDEQFSIFFAQTFSHTQLLFFFSNDIQPGLYYSLLKGLLQITTDVSILRFVSSTLPELLAYVLLSGTLLYAIDPQKKQLRLYAILGLTFLYFLNPFVIDQGWQIRMYGLVLFFSTASLFSYVLYSKTKTKMSLLLLVLANILGIATSYTFILLSALFAATFINKSNKSLLFKGVLSIGFGALLAAYFLLLSGYSSRSQFEYASWIPKPSVENTVSVYMTLLGLDSNIHGLDKNTDYAELTALSKAAVLALLSLLLYFLYKKNKKYLAGKSLVTFVLFPVTFIFLLSLLLEFFSHRAFFHTFVPNISLFLPRTHLVFVPFFWISVILFFINYSQDFILKIIREKNNSNRLYVYLILATIITFIAYSHTLFSVFNHRLTTFEKHQNALISTNDSQLVLPEWILYLTIDPSKMDHSEYPQLHDRIRASKIIRDSMYLFSTKSFCSVIQNSQSYTILPEYYLKHEIDAFMRFHEFMCINSIPHHATQTIYCTTADLIEHHTELNKQ